MPSRSRSVARILLSSQRRLEQIDSRRSRAPKTRQRLTVPRRRGNRPPTPAWSPRAHVERRPMRIMRHARDLW